MKKLIKITALVCALSAVCISAGCKENTAKEGKAYGLVHGGKYVGLATVSVKDDKITDATLTEVCLPGHVTAGEDVAEDDKVCDGDNCYYKNVSYGGVTLTYVAGSGYQSGETPLFKLLNNEQSAKEYFDAVNSNAVSVVVGGQKKTDIMNKASLSKEENGYWTRTDKDGNEYSRWKMNRDATIEYVKQYGVDNLTKLTKSETASPDKREDKEVNYWVYGGVSTGATWADLNKEGAEGYFTYAKLLTAAYNAAIA